MRATRTRGSRGEALSTPRKEPPPPSCPRGAGFLSLPHHLIPNPMAVLLPGLAFDWPAGRKPLNTQTHAPPLSLSHTHTPPWYEGGWTLPKKRLRLVGSQLCRPWSCPCIVREKGGAQRAVAAVGLPGNLMGVGGVILGFATRAMHWGPAAYGENGISVSSSLFSFLMSRGEKD